MVQFIIDAIAYVSAHGLEILHAVMGLLTALIAICMLIPGEQPEKALQGAVDFLSKFSRK